MKTKILLLTGLTAGLLFAAALPLAALPGPDDYKKTTDDVKKATASTKAGPLPQAPAPEDVNKALEAAKGNPPTPSETAGHQIKSQLSPGQRASTGAQSSSTFFPPSNDPKPTTSNPRRDPLPTNFGAKYMDGSQTPTSDTEDWHKKNKKNKQKHHDDGNNTYDGSPITYHKPKPTTSAQSKNTAEDAQGRFSVDFDATKSPPPEGQRSNLPYTFYGRYPDGSQKPTSDTEDWHKKNKNEHHHHHDGDGHHDDD